MSYELSDDTYIPRFPKREMNKKPKHPLSNKEMDLYLGQPFRDPDNLLNLKKLKEVVFRIYSDKKDIKNDKGEIHSVKIRSYYGFLKDSRYFNSCLITYLDSLIDLDRDLFFIRKTLPKLNDEKFLNFTDPSKYKESFNLMKKAWERTLKKDKKEVLELFTENVLENNNDDYLIDLIINNIHKNKIYYLEIYMKAIKFCSIESKKLEITKNLIKNIDYDYEYYNSFVYLVDKKNKFPVIKREKIDADKLFLLNESRIYNQDCKLYYDGTIRKYGYNAYQRRFGSSGSNYFGSSYEDDSDIRQEAEEYLNTIMIKFDKTKFLDIIVENVEEAKEGKNSPKTLHWIIRAFISRRVMWSAQETETWLKQTNKKRGSTQYNLYEESYEGNFSKYNYNNEATGYYFEALEKMTPKQRKFIKEILEIGTETKDLKKKYRNSYNELEKFYQCFKKKMQKHREAYKSDKGREVYSEKEEENYFPNEISSFLIKNSDPLEFANISEAYSHSLERINNHLKRLKNNQKKKKDSLSKEKEELNKFFDVVKESKKEFLSLKISNFKHYYDDFDFLLKAMKIKKTDLIEKCLISQEKFVKGIKQNKTVLRSLKKMNSDLFEEGEDFALEVISEDYLIKVNEILNNLMKKNLLKDLIEKEMFKILEIITKGKNNLYKIVNLDETDGNMIHYIVKKNNFKLANIILDLNMLEVDRIDSEGNTPLHIAVMNNQDDIARKLLSKGAKASIMNKEGKFPLDYKK